MFARLLTSLRKSDIWLIVSICVLIVLGTLIQYSLSIEPGVVFSDRIIRQFVYIGLAVGVFLVCTVLNYRSFILPPWIYVAGMIAALLAVLVFGTELKGATGWIIIGPVSTQPVEVVKILSIAFLAAVMKQRSDTVKHITVKDVGLTGGAIAMVLILILLQPDLGSAFIIAAIWFLFLLVAKAPKWCIAVVITLGILGAAMGWMFVFQDYQKDRLTVFLNLENDALGKGYNITQSIIAVGSGGVWGKGFGEGTQSQLQFLPEASSDFAFAVVAEEFGFVGALVVILCFSIMCWRLIRGMRSTQDPFAFFFLGGVVSYLVVQSTVVIGMNIGIMPVTGLPLPFISSGGSSLLVTAMMLGLAHSMRVHE